MTVEELGQAIVDPALYVGVAIEADLLAQLVSDVSEQPGTLPLLQFALTELFERRENRTLTQESYQAIGGVFGAIAQRAEEIFQELDSQGREIARQLFLRLVSLGEGTEDTRRRVMRSELETLAADRSLQYTGPDTELARSEAGH